MRRASRLRTLIRPVLPLLVLAGCASEPSTPGVRGANAAGDPSAARDAQASPSLDGAALLQRTCTMCHGLEGVRARAPYWGEPEWTDMVTTMIGYGAILSDEEFPVLVRYLGEEY